MKASQFLPLIGIAILQFSVGCRTQNQGITQKSENGREDAVNSIGGKCENCDLIYVGMPKEMHSVDTSAGWHEKGQKLVITGTVFQTDGTTPDPDVVVYYYHTDNDGYYSKRYDKPENQTLHGHIRGWVKTDADGRYTIYTIRPAPYPNNEIPSHIHLEIKEPDIAKEYYVEDINFDDDKLLIPYYKNHPPENRGGSGLVRILLKDSLQIAEHNIVVGLNIPNYRKSTTPNKQSGLHIGEDQPSFSPYHAYGPDRGTQACPICKYGRYHGIIYFVGNHPDWKEIRKWLHYLEEESIERRKYLKAYFVYGNEKSYSKQSRLKELADLGNELGIKNMALTFVPSFSDVSTNVNLNKIDPDVENTFIVYKHGNIVDKYIDLKQTRENSRRISETLDRTQGRFFDLPEIKYQ